MVYKVIGIRSSESLDGKIVAIRVGPSEKEKKEKFWRSRMQYLRTLADVKSGELTLGNPDDPDYQRHKEYIK